MLCVVSMVKKYSKIGRNWSYRYRMIDGKRRRVKVRRVGNKTRVRVVGHRNKADTIRRRKK